jgi:Domain of unknown function (DUF4440)
LEQRRVAYQNPNEEEIMRLMYALVLLAGFALPVQADDAALKQEVDKMSDAYMESYNKHDPAGVAKLFSSNDYVYVSATSGVVTDMTTLLERVFKMVPDAKLDTKVEKVWMITPDVLAAQGTAKITGKNASTGAEINSDNLWTAVYVKELDHSGSVWKIRMLTGVLKPPPAK